MRHLPYSRHRTDFIGFDRFNLSSIPLDAGFLILFKQNGVYRIYIDFELNAYDFETKELLERREINETLVASMVTKVFWNVDDTAVKALIHDAGWYYGYSIPYSLYHQIVELYSKGRQDEANTQIRAYFTESRLKSWLFQWAQNEHFAEIIEILEEGISFYLEERYRVSVLSMLPYLERIAAKAIGQTGKAKDLIERLLRKKITFENSLHEAMWRDLRKHMVNYLYQDFVWEERPVFSRHSVFHGARIDFEWFHSLQIIIAYNELYFFMNSFQWE